MSELVREYEEKEEKSIENILKGATESRSKSTSRMVGTAGVMSMVNAPTGVRLTFPDTVLEEIGSPDKLQVRYNTDESTIVIGENLGNKNYYTIKKSGRKGIIYAANLVRELTQAFELDFSDRSSITFHDIEYIQDEENSIAIIKIKTE